MIHKIGRREDIGDLLADGVKVAAKQLGSDFEELAVEGKGLEVPMHDPRAYISNALNYAVGNRGACHIDCAGFVFESGLPFPDFGYNGPMDRFSTDGKALLTMRSHDLMTLYDAIGVCKFYFIPGHGPTIFNEWIHFATGWDYDFDGIMQVGERIFTMKRMFNVRRGAAAKDDYLAKRLMKIPQRDDIPPVSPEKLEVMRHEYYQLRGWNEQGIPTEEKLKALGLA
jgi:aldehyde:ferredoxin oxidoreductase